MYIHTSWVHYSPEHFLAVRAVGWLPKVLFDKLVSAELLYLGLPESSPPPSQCSGIFVLLKGLNLLWSAGCFSQLDRRHTFPEWRGWGCFVAILRRHCPIWHRDLRPIGDIRCWTTKGREGGHSEGSLCYVHTYIHMQGLNCLGSNFHAPNTGTYGTVL